MSTYFKGINSSYITFLGGSINNCNIGLEFENCKHIILKNLNINTSEKGIVLNHCWNTYAGNNKINIRKNNKINLLTSSILKIIYS